ncbi:MAG TPA: NAD(P)/FAD-dependent oxidoreductase [Candidatus Binatia bacterium]|nr:NAD(P)/FAD-dependent oxidoreductase [Candidatus Binatia bacterium]
MADVVVVGAGPAGSAIALCCVRAGIEVMLIERAEFPRRKVCGEYVNAGAVRALAELGVLDAVRAYAFELRGIKLFSGPLSAEVPFSATALAIERSRLDALLLDAAIDAGTHVVRGRVEGLIEDAGRIGGVRWRDEAGNMHATRARFVVGADGAGSLVARKAGLARPRRRGRFAVGGHYTGFDGLDRWIELYLGEGTYFAINPLDDERANVMVVIPQRDLAAMSSDVDDGLRGRAARLAGGHRSLTATSRVGARVSVGPLVHATSRAAAPGVLLCGDAAGLLDPFTGQGVLLALTSATRAGAAIVEASASRGREASAFARYARETSRELAVRRRVGTAIDLLVNVTPIARRAAARARALPDVASALLDAVSGLRPPQSALRPSTLGRLLV